MGEKLLWAFQWDMSGIDVNANTDIGRHTSAIVRTITTIGSDLDGSKMSKVRTYVLHYNYGSEFEQPQLLFCLTDCDNF